MATAVLLQVPLPPVGEETGCRCHLDNKMYQKQKKKIECPCLPSRFGGSGSTILRLPAAFSLSWNELISDGRRTPAVPMSVSLCLCESASRDPFLEWVRDAGLEPINERAGDGDLERVPELEIMRGPCRARAGCGRWLGWFGTCGERVPLARGSGREVNCVVGLL